MSNSDELNIARKKLFDSLGDNFKPYCQLLRLWFSMKATKEEFDIEARRIMTKEQTKLHNEFLVSLFAKCSFLATDGKCKNKFQKKTKVNKPKKSGDKGAFQLADPVNYLPILESAPSNLQDEPQRYSVQELFLPDQSLILSRLLLTSWEMGMEGAEDSAAELLVVAVQHFLKNILTVVLTQRNGYKRRENRFTYSVGSLVPNPWLRNYRNIKDTSMYSSATDVIDSDDNDFHVPRSPFTPEEIERRDAFALACANGNKNTTCTSAVSAFEVLQALQVHKSTIPSHSLYAINMERIISMLYHMSHEEIEAAAFLQLNAQS